MIPEWWPHVCYDDAVQGCENRYIIAQIATKDEESSSDSRRVHLRTEKKEKEESKSEKKKEKDNSDGCAYGVS